MTGPDAASDDARLRGSAAAAASPPVSVLHSIAAAAIIIAGLYFARDILVPFALAVLLTFLLAPIVLRLRRLGLGRVPAIIGVVTLAFATLAIAGWSVSIQILDLARSLPGYEANIRGKLQNFGAPGGGLLTETSDMIKHLGEDLGAEAALDPESGPLQVQIREPEATSLDLLRNAAGALLGPLATTGVVVVLVIFMLVQREDLRERFFSLIGAGHVYVTTDALDDAARRISRYLSMQLLVNLSYGIPVGVGLYFIGVPNPLLWGILATLLRFVPYIGPLLAITMPLTLAFAVDPGWSMALATLGLFIALELFSNNVMEPWLYGASTGISPVAIMMAAIFWASLWGPAGLLLSTPLTVCLVVLGRHIPQLRFLAVMLGTEQALAPEVRFYQRLLAADIEEAIEIAEAFAVERGLARTYDELVLPALILIEQDRHRGSLDEARKSFIMEHAGELVDHLDERDSNGDAPPAAAGRPRVVLLPARDDADELAARMLAHLLRRQSIDSEIISARLLLGQRLEAVRPEDGAVACVCAVPPQALPHAAYTCKRLRRRHPDLWTMVGVYSDRADPQKLRTQLPSDLAEVVVTSLSEALARLTERLSSPGQQWKPAPIPVNEQERLAELTSLDLLDTPPEEAFDRVTRELAHIFGAPISLMSLIDDDRQFWKSHFGLPPDLAAAGASDRESSMCGHVVGENDVLVVNDTHADARFASNPFLQRCGIRFYAGAPLRTRSGSAIGSLCVIDTKPRTITDRERELLRMIADAVMTEVELRTTSRGLSEVSQQLVEENRALQEQRAAAARPS